MLKSLSNLKGRTMVAIDGDFGTVSDLLFDEDSWTVRYLVVKVGNILNRRQVLISPAHIRASGGDDIYLPVNLTQEQILESPDIDSDAPVSRMAETSYYDYYQLPYYWSGPLAWGNVTSPLGLTPTSPSSLGANTVSPGANPLGSDSVAVEGSLQEAAIHTHIRSLNEVVGYAVSSSDGENFGSIDDFIADDESWSVRYLIVDTIRNWPSKSVLLSPAWVTDISWAQEQIAFDLRQDEIKAAPQFRSLLQLSRDDEESLHSHYRRPGYWHHQTPQKKNESETRG